jgi:cellulose synthase (UDP-forming)
MKEFNDDRVGYVATPSICDTNTDQSWTVRARVYWESTLQGCLQAGSQSRFNPMCFGSHYSVRTAALADIGGIGPEIAEDHTTTMLMSAKDWKGGYANYAVAHGMGAVGIKDSMRQEYQWATVGMRAFLLIGKEYFLKLSLIHKIQFLIWWLWYPAVSFVTAISLVLPAYLIVTNKQIMILNGNFFWPLYMGQNLLFISYLVYLKYIKQLRPVDSWAISWETFVFQLLQIPWIALGVIEGFYQVLTKYNPLLNKKIKITNKTKSVRGIEFGWLMPHLIIILFNLMAILYGFRFHPQNSYIWFAWINCISYSIAISVGIVLSIKECTHKEIHIFDKLIHYGRYVFNHQPTIYLTIFLMMLSVLTVPVQANMQNINSNINSLTTQLIKSTGYVTIFAQSTK